MDNKTGIHPTEYRVLVEPKAVEEKTAGGIIIPDMTKDSEKYAQVEGTIIAASPLAFTYATAAEWEAANAKPPKPGDRVLHAKYAGVRVKGKDGKEYLLVNDKDLTATIEE
jgi:chaperonin GroES